MVLSHLQSIMLNITNIFPVKVFIMIIPFSWLKGVIQNVRGHHVKFHSHDGIMKCFLHYMSLWGVIRVFSSHRSQMYSLLWAWTSSWTSRWIANDFKSYETHVTSPWFPVVQDFALPITQNGFARWDPGHWFNVLTGKELKMCSKIITPEHPIQMGIPQKTYNLLELT